jgi:alpha-tubulin suppressor-like RCC1 family protein
MAITQVTSNVIQDDTIKSDKLSSGGPSWDSSGSLSAVGFFGDGSQLTGLISTISASTIIQAITGNKIPGTINAKGFFGDGSRLTGTVSSLSVIEVTNNTFLVEPIHNNGVVLLNSLSTVNIYTDIFGTYTPGHQTIFIQTNTGRGNFVSSGIYSINNINVTKGRYSVCELLNLSGNNIWSLYGDLSTTPVSLPQIPTYSLSANLLSATEGLDITFALNTTNVTDSTIAYTISGTISAADLRPESAGITGNFNLVNNTATIVLQLTEDFEIENEVINLTLNNGQANISIPVIDTYQAPRFSGIFSATNSTLALSGDILYGTGTNGSGQLGLSISPYTQLNYSQFTKVTVAQSGATTINNPRFTSVEAGPFGSLALSGENLFAAGFVPDGHLGFKPTGISLVTTFTRIALATQDSPRIDYNNPKFTAIAIGFDASYALSGENLFSTGQTTYGQLGQGDIFIHKSTFTRIAQAQGITNPKFTAIAATFWSFFALSGNDLYACGRNFETNLGLPRTNPSRGDTNYDLLTRVLSARNGNVTINNAKFTKVAPAGIHTLALSGTDLYAVGSSLGLGALGLGSGVNNASIFTKILSAQNGPTIITNPQFTEIAASVTLSLALSGTDLYGCGRNASGELGLNNTAITSIFTKVLSARNIHGVVINPKFTAISCPNTSGEFSFALSGTDLYVTGWDVSNGKFGLNRPSSNLLLFTQVSSVAI